MITEIKAPNEVYWDIKIPTVFLAGSIDMGKAEDWQCRLVKKLSTTKIDAVILNPRRDDWDSSWKQSMHNKQFREQVEWELEGLKKVDIIVMNFVSGYKSPISLLELGLCIDKENILVCCPAEFYRRGNVEITCLKYGVPIYDKFEHMVYALESLIAEKEDMKHEE